MIEARIGQRVLTGHGEGIIDTIAAGDADTDILQYRITSGSQPHWYYLDEIIIASNITTP